MAGIGTLANMPKEPLPTPKPGEPHRRPVEEPQPDVPPEQLPPDNPQQDRPLSDPLPPDSDLPRA